MTPIASAVTAPDDVVAGLDPAMHSGTERTALQRNASGRGQVAGSSPATTGLARAAAPSVCAHCGLPTAPGHRFCCPGCAAAYETIQTLGLDRYYQQRLLDPSLRAPRPDIGERHDLTRHIASHANGSCELSLAVDGLQCGACVWLIESVLARDPAVLVGRVNMTTRRLKLVWRGGAEQADRHVAAIEALGYRLVPYDPAALAAAQDQASRALLRALAVAGFAAGNVMLISIGIWAGDSTGLLRDMGPATRDLLHWVSALIALPAIAYAGRPFFTSAVAALRHFRSNMDVPISLGVILVSGISLAQTVGGGAHTYFDSAITLLFFLLVGRVLDHRARGQARTTAEQLLTLRSADVAVLGENGTTLRRPSQSVAAGERVLVAAGERIGVDGVVVTGASTLDTSLVTGESLPVPAAPGTAVFAGTLNLNGALTVRATAAGGATLLAECVRLIEAAEARRGRFVVLADRVARLYAPAVHVTALASFGWWFGIADVGLAQALLTACAVLIVTCPCAVALAVPAVQVIATSGLFRSGILLKSPTALERLAEVDTVVFDKTGTLTEPALALASDGVDPKALAVAASVAATSRHPLARALVAVAGPVVAAEGVVEHHGLGLQVGDVRLGSRVFCGIEAGVRTEHPLRLQEGEGERGPYVWSRGQRVPPPLPTLDPLRGPSPQGEEELQADTTPELWLTRPDHPPVRFAFTETLRADAVAIIGQLRAMGLRIALLSGDRAGAVAPIAAALDIADWQAGRTPVQKVAAIEALRADRRRVLMVGDGLNDSPSLAAATVSASPATAADLSQTVADIVFQGTKLVPVLQALATARHARSVMRQNLTLAIGYNALMVPLAIGGFVTPWLAAAAMSSSSLLVIANSFRAKPGARA